MKEARAEVRKEERAEVRKEERAEVRKEERAGTSPAPYYIRGVCFGG